MPLADLGSRAPAPQQRRGGGLGQMLGQALRGAGNALGGAYNQNRDLWILQAQAAAMPGNSMQNFVALEEQAKRNTMEKRKLEFEMEQAKREQEALEKYRKAQLEIAKLGNDIQERRAQIQAAKAVADTAAKRREIELKEAKLEQDERQMDAYIRNMNSLIGNRTRSYEDMTEAERQAQGIHGPAQREAGTNRIYIPGGRAPEDPFNAYLRAILGNMGQPNPGQVGGGQPTNPLMPGMPDPFERFIPRQ